MMGVFVQTNTGSRRAGTELVGYVIQESGCWDWVGGTINGGYGRMWYNGKQRLAHRAMYEQLHGPIPDDLQCDHLCRNRLCVNPAHMEIVTQRENILRGQGIAAKHARRTHCSSGHPLSGDNLVVARLRYGSRICRICNNARERATSRRPRASQRVTV